jgi:lipopolysaccharide/colanic/teichoic acid biosynthesis glycosyltransferase
MAYDDGPFDYRRVSGSVAPAFRRNRSVKRAFDIVAAGIGLLLFSPILLIVSIAIKLDSRGPVFCRETLYGYKDRGIRVFKFRSMTACAEADRTLTRVGQVLRQTGIEDIPQLLNVLLGEMSIVGPRPYASRQHLFEYGLMPLLNGFKPGMTGLAQINDARQGFGTTKQHINDDVRYVETWSLLLDIKIILMTLFLRKL